MIKSMTGYGRYGQIIEGRLITAEVKSINHRYVECTTRLPKGYGFLERQLKSFIQSQISRGKLDIAITIESADDTQVCIQINEAVANGYMQALKTLAQQLGLKEEIDILTIAAYPDVLTVQQLQEDEEQLWLWIKQVAGKALDDLLIMREQEGQSLKQDILRRVSEIERLIQQVEMRSPKTVEEYKERLHTRVQELVNDQEYNEARLYMEIVLFADKVSVAEETVRLHSHVNQLKHMLESTEPVGRKLDFLVQEMNREANTIASKAVDTQIAYIVVEIKAEIEKIREQVQNIE